MAHMWDVGGGLSKHSLEVQTRLDFVFVLTLSEP